MAKSFLMTTDVLLARIDTLTQKVERQRGARKTAHLTIDKLNLELAYLRHMRYGRSSEQLNAQQLLRRFSAMQTSLSSASHLASPRMLNWRNASTFLIQPLGGSPIHL